MYQKIALALAFSPRWEALLREVKRLVDLFGSELILIHVGERVPEKEEKLNNELKKVGLDTSLLKIAWEKGDPAKRIIQVCKHEEVDLLIAGALKKEGFFRYYIGSIARKIIRKSSCSVLVLIEPTKEPLPLKRIVINGTQQEQTPHVIERGLTWCKAEKARQVYIVNEIKMYGLQMATAGQGGEKEIVNTKRKLVADEIAYVEDILKTLDKGDLKISIKITSGRWSTELAKFAEDTKADLLILGDEGKLGFLDRLFPHDLEDILSNLPCNLLIIKK